jgi:hypothetical protein
MPVVDQTIWLINREKPFYWRVIRDFLLSSSWFIAFILLFWIRDGINYIAPLILLPAFLLIFVKHFRSNAIYVRKVEVKEGQITIEYFKFNQLASTSFVLKDVKVDYCRSVRSYPLQTRLEYKRKGERLFRHFQTYGWKEKDLLEIKTQIDKIQGEKETGHS